MATLTATCTGPTATPEASSRAPTLPGLTSFLGHDPESDVTLVIWANLTFSSDGQTTANAMLPPILDEIYVGLASASCPISIVSGDGFRSV